MCAINVQLTLVRGAICVAAAALFSITGCSSGEDESNHQTQAEVIIDRTLSAGDIDPAVYFDFDDPGDPFHDVYAAFRARRSADMADASKPPPIEPYEAVHITRNMPWNSLQEVLPFDWAAIREASPGEAALLE